MLASQSPVLLQIQDPLEQVLPLQHGPGKRQFPEGLQQLPDEADLLILLCSLQHGTQRGYQIRRCCQLGESESPCGAYHGLKLGLPDCESQLLPAVLPHVTHEVGKVTCHTKVEVIRLQVIPIGDVFTGLIACMLQ